MSCWNQKNIFGNGAGSDEFVLYVLRTAAAKLFQFCLVRKYRGGWSNLKMGANTLWRHVTWPASVTKNNFNYFAKPAIAFCIIFCWIWMFFVQFVSCSLLDYSILLKVIHAALIYELIPWHNHEIILRKTAIMRSD